MHTLLQYGNQGEGRDPSVRFPAFHPDNHNALDLLARESAEKSLHLGELRHRMKNNLQAIQSLLRLQKARTQNPDVKKELAYIEMHVAALNGVQGELLVAEARVPVALANYLRRLARMLKIAFGDSARPVLLRLELDDVEVTAEEAANIGILVNEAITNSFRHAVPHGASEVRLSLKRETKTAVLTISDDGPGFDLHNQPHKGGTQLMARLADRLKASFEQDLSQPGTCYRVHLPFSRSGGGKL